jgi:hypothetical protein
VQPVPCFAEFARKAPQPNRLRPVETRDGEPGFYQDRPIGGRSGSFGSAPSSDILAGMSHAADTSSLIAIDVGNSRIKFGLFEMAEIRAAQSGTLPECRRVVSFPLNEDVPSDRLTTWVAAADSTIAGAVLAGVNPGGVERVLAVWPELGWPAPATINHPGQLPLVVRVDAPERVGIDRLLNAVAANRLRDRDVPLIIVSSGTATRSKGGRSCLGSICARWRSTGTRPCCRSFRPPSCRDRPRTRSGRTRATPFVAGCSGDRWAPCAS